MKATERQGKAQNQSRLEQVVRMLTGSNVPKVCPVSANKKGDTIEDVALKC